MKTADVSLSRQDVPHPEREQPDRFIKIRIQLLGKKLCQSWSVCRCQMCWGDICCALLGIALILPGRGYAIVA